MLEIDVSGVKGQIFEQEDVSLEEVARKSGGELKTSVDPFDLIKYPGLIAELRRHKLESATFYVLVINHRNGTNETHNFHDSLVLMEDKAVTFVQPPRRPLTN